MNKAHLTAIARNKLSTPAKYLDSKGLLRAYDVLDYGCGRGFDADELGLDKYDPHYFPQRPTIQYDTIMCNFVLNVLPEVQEREAVLQDILSLLKPGGCAYIAVRNDRANLNGYTKRGTWQGLIELSLPVEKKTANFIMYRLDKP